MSKAFVLVITIFFIGPPGHVPEVAAFRYDTIDACLDARDDAVSREGQGDIIDVEATCFEVDNKHAAPT